MPFGRTPGERRHYDRLYRRIRRAVESFAGDGRIFECRRSDEFTTPGSITDTLFHRLADADVVIADISADNPNVFYELGIRHARHSGTILIADTGKSLDFRPPFDLATHRVIPFGVGRRYRGADRTIHESLAALPDDGSEQDSPVLKALLSLEGPSRRWLWGTKNGRPVLPIENLWMERIDRGSPGKADIHFSIFALKPSPGPLDPYVMEGFSFDAGGALHSRWGTKYLRVKSAERNEIVIEYVYWAYIVGETVPRAGFGLSRFGTDIEGEMTVGGGFYLAGEEPQPQRRNCELHRLGPDLCRRMGIRQPLARGSLERAVPALAEEFGVGPVTVDPMFTPAGPRAGIHRGRVSRLGRSGRLRKSRSRT